MCIALAYRFETSSFLKGGAYAAVGAAASVHQAEPW